MNEKNFVDRLLQIHQAMGDTVLITVGVRNSKLDLISVKNAFENKTTEESQETSESQSEIPSYFG
jgi:hypothetical protein